MRVKLDRDDWVTGLNAAIGLLKNALAQVEVYKIQVEVSQKMVDSFPKPKIKKLKKTGIPHTSLNLTGKKIGLNTSPPK